MHDLRASQPPQNDRLLPLEGEKHGSPIAALAMHYLARRNGEAVAMAMEIVRATWKAYSLSTRTNLPREVFNGEVYL